MKCAPQDATHLGRRRHYVNHVSVENLASITLLYPNQRVVIVPSVRTPLRQARRNVFRVLLEVPAHPMALLYTLVAIEALTILTKARHNVCLALVALMAR